MRLIRREHDVVLNSLLGITKAAKVILKYHKSAEQSPFSYAETMNQPPCA